MNNQIKPIAIICAVSIALIFIIMIAMNKFSDSK